MARRHDSLIAGPVARIRARRPLRAWSLIVTIYGDAVVPRGGSLWLGSLLEMMAGFGIEGGVVRTAMSRLARDGWIERRRVGRQSYYRLSPKGKTEFVAAATQIYAAGPSPWDGRWTVALLDEPAGTERQARRAAMAGTGFAAFAPNVLLRPGSGSIAPSGAMTMLEARSESPQEARRLAARLWPLETLGAGYSRFAEAFAPAAKERLAQDLSPRDAFVLRIALIHEYRRLVLRDPGLPAELLPTDWPGARARKLARAVYERLLRPSEAWLDAHGQSEAGPLPPPGPDFRTRFGGLNPGVD